MSHKDRVNNLYFEWLFDLVCSKKSSRTISYRKLLMHLHTIEFIYSIPKDENRADDGMNLRYRYTLDQDCEDDLLYLDGPCSVLEMMIALAIRCEEDIMDDPLVGDRTGQWFWGMIVNLGLGSMTDGRFNRKTVDDIMERFLYRDYEPNGKGGLFTIKNTMRDLRDVEIWHQLCWYLDTIT